MISKPFLVLGALVAASSVSVGGYYIHKNISSKEKEPVEITKPVNKTQDAATPSESAGGTNSQEGLGA